MAMPRRDFISAVSMSATAISLHAAGLLNGVARWDGSPQEYAVLDLGHECLLRESLLGYQGALTATACCLTQFEDAKLAVYRNVIVPGVGALSESTAQRVLRLLEPGTQVLLESAAGFCDSSGFATHQRIMREYFDVTVEPPIDLWTLQRCYDNAVPGRGGRSDAFPKERAPYIDFVWPANLSVRDFSNVVPISAKDSDVIAHAGSRAVAVRKRLAQGTVVFLGSPLGPGLRAGEPEAHLMLELLTSETSEPHPVI